MDTADRLDLIGTPRYPLNQPDHKHIFPPGTGEVIRNEGLAALMREVHKQTPFKCGVCYTNTKAVVMNALGNGWSNVVPYAGWLVIEGKFLHHAWAVLNHGLVIDFSILLEGVRLRDEFWHDWNPKMLEFMKRGTKEAVAEWEITWRKAWIEKSMAYELGDIVQHRVWGMVPVGHTYVGCPCGWDEARNIFKRWHSRYGEGEGPGVKSPMQMMEELIRGGQGGKINEAIKHLRRKQK